MDVRSGAELYGFSPQMYWAKVMPHFKESTSTPVSGLNSKHDTFHQTSPMQKAGPILFLCFSLTLVHPSIP